MRQAIYIGKDTVDYINYGQTGSFKKDAYRGFAGFFYPDGGMLYKGEIDDSGYSVDLKEIYFPAL